MAVGDVFKLQLENITSSGDALGRFEGKPVFIEMGAPDETVLCRITQEHNTWARAELLEIIDPSPVRLNPVCAFYGRCGGCSLQHIDYKAQLDSKVSILKEMFLRIGRIDAPEPEVFASPPYTYRNRMQFHCLRQKAKSEHDLKFGLMGRRSGEIIAVSDCPIAVHGIRELLQSSSSGNAKGAADDDKRITLPVEKDRFTVFFKDNVFLNEGGVQREKIKLLDKKLTIDAGVFFQSNCFMLEKLIMELQKIAEGAERALPAADLYSGAGTFALFLGDMFPKIVLAEENKIAVSLARENLRGINAEFFALRDTEWQKNLLSCAGAFGFAVADPPRAGLAPKLAAVLAQNGPPALAYVSCDPAALARDSKVLINGGYQLKELKFFDFYPQTAHIESLAVFKK
ncbi:MAG: TRAM domain-containing protein [Treponema sp.]|nr:TRAM domain-containing protein [Treponema sp.]